MASVAMPLSSACSKAGLLFLVNQRSGSPSLTARTGLARRFPSCKSVSDGGSPAPVYQGVYGPWTVEPADVREKVERLPLMVSRALWFEREYDVCENHDRLTAGFDTMIKLLSDSGCVIVASESSPTHYWLLPVIGVKVILYRSGLVTAATSLVIASSTTFLPESSLLREIIEKNLNLFYALGAGGLGLSLLLIHIYITAIKRTLQALWVLGVAGSFATYVYLAQPSGENLVQYVLENPTAVWFVGPLFAALTGLVFKEGLCYGKLEAGILTFIIPTVLLGHLTGLMDDGVKTALLGTWMALFVIFAGRKFTQPVKDDIGDKSVFMFNALPEDGKQALIEKLELQKTSGK